MPTIQPNPSVPVTVDPITGTVHVPVDQASGAAVVAEAKASGNLYLVPAGKTFTGIAVLLVGTGVGVTEIEDASSNVYAAAGGTTPGVPAIPVIAPTVSVAGGGGGNQLSVALSGSAEVLSAVIAGYVK